MSKRDGGPDDCAHRFLKAHRAGQAVCVYCGKPLHNIAPPEPEWKDDQNGK